MMFLTLKKCISLMFSHFPIILVEVIMVFGGVLLFAWWQLRELKKLRQEREQKQDKSS